MSNPPFPPNFFQPSNPSYPNGGNASFNMPSQNQMSPSNPNINFGNFNTNDMKKAYLKPHLKIVKLNRRTQLLSASRLTVTKTNTNLGDEDDFEYGGAGDDDIVAR